MNIDIYIVFSFTYVTIDVSQYDTKTNMNIDIYVIVFSFTEVYGSDTTIDLKTNMIAD